MWEQYARIHPFGHQNRLLAQIAVRLYNATRAETSDVAELDNFLPIEIPQEEIKQGILEKEFAKAVNRSKR